MPWAALWPLLLLALLVTPARAAQLQVLVLAEDGVSYHRQFLSNFQRTLEDSRTDVQVLRRDVSDLRADEPAPAGDPLIITVGARAARLSVERFPDATTLHTLIPAATFEQLLEPLSPAQRAKHRGLLIDQPPGRLLDLIQVALPGRTIVGTLNGPQSQHLIPRLRHQAKRRALTLVTRSVRGQGEVAAALKDILAGAQVLLTIPDSTVVNSKTAKTLILSAYLQRIPIVGYSRALVKAGALLAVHSTPDQLGRQAAEVLASVASHGAATLPVATYPSHYTVTVNYQVARALNIDLPTEDILLNTLRALEAKR